MRSKPPINELPLCAHGIFFSHLSVLVGCTYFGKMARYNCMALQELILPPSQIIWYCQNSRPLLFSMWDVFLFNKNEQITIPMKFTELIVFLFRSWRGELVHFPITDQLHGAESFLRSYEYAQTVKKFPTLWNPKVQHRVHKNPPLVPILSQMIQSISPNPISLKSIRLLSSHLRQPTKKLTKGGVLRKRQTSSLARFNHSCVRNALLEMVRGALKL
jgi:hypothetical protein